jgi:hypothetical protein
MHGRRARINNSLFETLRAKEAGLRLRPRSSLSVTRFSNVSYARRPGLGLGKSSLLRCALAADGVHPSCKASCCDDSCGSVMHKRFNNLSRAGVHLVCSMVGRSNLLI